MQAALRRALGSARYNAYLAEAGGDPSLAADLYTWNIELSGAWHAHLSYVEVTLRNAIDNELRLWHVQGGHSGEWTQRGNALKVLYNVFHSPLKNARRNALKEADQRPHRHPRFGQAPTHDDVVVQLTFGNWTNLLRPTSGPVTDNHVALWAQCLCHAFPHAEDDDSGRSDVGAKLERMRKLRNRVAHHEPLLSVDTRVRLGESLSLLASIDPSVVDLVMARNKLRRLAKEDPRL